MRGGAFLKGVSVCEIRDMDERKKLLKPEIHMLNAEAAGAMPQNLLASTSARMRSLRTNGNGACDMHALFGMPTPTANGALELFTHDARILAAQHFFLDRR